MNRRVLAWLILVSWFGSLGWLTFRERASALDPFDRDGGTLLPPETIFYGVRAATGQVGVASVTVDTTATGFRVTERTGVDLPRDGEVRRANVLADYELSPDLRLLSWRITLPAPGGNFAIAGVVEDDTVLRVRLGEGDAARELRLVPGTRPVPLAAATWWLSARGRLQPGLVTAVPVFDPVGLTMDTVTFSVGPSHRVAVVDSAEFNERVGMWVPATRDSVFVWDVHRSDLAGTQALDRYGRTTLTFGMPGLVWTRSAFELVNTNYRLRQRRNRTRSLEGMPEYTTALEDGQVPSRTRVARLNLIVSVPEHTLDTAGFDPLHGDRVTWTEDRLTVTAGAAPRTASPPDSAARDSLARWLAPDPWIASDDSAAVALSRQVAGRAGDPVAVARRLTAWVDRRLRDAPAEPATTGAVLQDRRGDADAHALALAALARAAGIPARPVAGLLLVGDRFYLHSWTELYLGGWVEVDPMLGQFPVDARHLRIATDGRARLDVLLPLIGGLRLWTTPDSGTP